MANIFVQIRRTSYPSGRNKIRFLSNSTTVSNNHINVFMDSHTEKYLIDNYNCVLNIPSFIFIYKHITTYINKYVKNSNCAIEINSDQYTTSVNIVDKAYEYSANKQYYYSPIHVMFNYVIVSDSIDVIESNNARLSNRFLFNNFFNIFNIYCGRKNSLINNINILPSVNMNTIPNDFYNRYDSETNICSINNKKYNNEIANIIPSFIHNQLDDDILYKNLLGIDVVPNNIYKHVYNNIYIYYEQEIETIINSEYVRFKNLENNYSIQIMDSRIKKISIIDSYSDVLNFIIRTSKSGKNTNSKNNKILLDADSIEIEIHNSVVNTLNVLGEFNSKAKISINNPIGTIMIYNKEINVGYSKLFNDELFNDTLIYDLSYLTSCESIISSYGSLILPNNIVYKDKIYNVCESTINKITTYGSNILIKGYELSNIKYLDMDNSKNINTDIFVESCKYARNIHFNILCTQYELKYLRFVPNSMNMSGELFVDGSNIEKFVGDIIDTNKFKFIVYNNPLITKYYTLDYKYDKLTNRGDIVIDEYCIDEEILITGNVNKLIISRDVNKKRPKIIRIENSTIKYMDIDVIIDNELSIINSHISVINMNIECIGNNCSIVFDNFTSTFENINDDNINVRGYIDELTIRNDVFTMNMAVIKMLKSDEIKILNSNILNLYNNLILYPLDITRCDKIIIDNCNINMIHMRNDQKRYVNNCIFINKNDENEIDEIDVSN